MKLPVVRATVLAGSLGLMLGMLIGIGLTQVHLPWLDLSRFDGEQSDYDPEFLKRFNLKNLQVPRRQLLRGGPTKDGIPALDLPEAVSAYDVNFLAPDDRIVGVHLNGEARAYPIRLLNWHEIVNDELGGIPIAVIYCPLCDSVSVVDRGAEGTPLMFGVSGLLFQSNVLLFDREHNALWSQIKLEAVSGPYAGRSLRHYPWSITTFERWKQAHPDGTVVNFETGHLRDYDRNPYASYLESDRLLFEVAHEDERLPRKAPVIGLRLGETVIAYPINVIHELPDHRLVETIHGERLVIEADAESGDVTVIESPADARLIHTFWFSWASAHPETRLYGPP